MSDEGHLIAFAPLRASTNMIAEAPVLAFSVYRKRLCDYMYAFGAASYV